MPLTCCPRCRLPVTAAMTTCSCGLDLAAVREELARLMRPNPTIQWPFRVLAKLPAAERQTLVHDIERAVASECSHDDDRQDR